MPSAKDRRKKQDKRAGEGTADGKRTAEAHSQGFPIRNAPAGRQNPVYDQKWKEDVNKAEVFS